VVVLAGTDPQRPAVGGLLLMPGYSTTELGVLTPRAMTKVELAAAIRLSMRSRTGFKLNGTRQQIVMMVLSEPVSVSPLGVEPDASWRMR
jgi:hypothetical protein